MKALKVINTILLITAIIFAFIFVPKGCDEDYAKNIEISAIDKYMSNSASAVIEFRIANHGNRKINEIELEITINNNSQKTTFDTTWTFYSWYLQSDECTVAQRIAINTSNNFIKSASSLSSLKFTYKIKNITFRA